MGTDHFAQEFIPYKVTSSTKLKRTRDYAKAMPTINNFLCYRIHHANVKICQVSIKVYQPNILLNKHLQNPGINPQKETNRPGTGYKIKPKLKAVHTYVTSTVFESKDDPTQMTKAVIYNLYTLLHTENYTL